MKKTILLLFFGLFTFYAMAQVEPKTPPVVQVPTITSTEIAPTEPSAVTSRDSSEIPDSVCVQTKSGLICIPTGDTKALIDILMDVANENKGNWPTTLFGWITLIVGLAFSVRGTIALTAAKRIYAFLKVFLRSTLNIVAFAAGGLATGVTFLLGKGEFDWNTFGILWPSLAFVAVYVYEAKFKKPDPEPEKSK